MLKILITGVTGQDGYNMVAFLLKQPLKYDIYGGYNNKLVDDPLLNNIKLIKLDLSNNENIEYCFKSILPDYFINFAGAQPQFEKNNIKMFQINTLSTIFILDCILKYNPNCKYFSAGSCMEYDISTSTSTSTSTFDPTSTFDSIPAFDSTIDPNSSSNSTINSNSIGIINIDTLTQPNTPYGISKLANRHLVEYYRNKFNIFAIHAILFNHDSYRRTEHFILKKIINHLQIIKAGKIITPIVCENIDICKDWSDSRDFIEAIWLMLNHSVPLTYILSSGKLNSLINFINIVCKYLNINTVWKEDNNKLLLYHNNNIILIGKHSKDNIFIIGNNNETKKLLNWNPHITFEKMIFDMIFNDS